MADAAEAQTPPPPDCQAATLPGIPDEIAASAPRIWGRGGSAPNVLVGRLAADLLKSSEPLIVFYKSDGACKALDSLDSATHTKLSTGSLQYWYHAADGSVKRQECTLDANAAPVYATWGSMAQLATTCNGYAAGLPADISDTVGPISAFSLFVHKDSTQQAISAEAAYYIYGFGPETYQVAPWTVGTAIGSRGTTSAAGLLLAKAVGIPLTHPLYGSTGTPNPTYAADGSKGPNDVATNGNMVKFVTATGGAGNAENSLGFASTETIDIARENVRGLAFQAKGQNWAYWPDSDATTSFDKINVRQGRYFLWNPHHFYAKLDGPSGQIVDANTKRWVEYITGKTKLPDNQSFLDVQIDVGNIPDCAMQVTRDGDVGPLASYQPEVSCGCYFEDHKQNGVHSDSCQACVNQAGDELPGEAADATCPATAPYCRYGFCEVK
ncbi:MAG: hypothetical protein QM778_23145 [Myxococcales bacterium]